MSFLEKSLSAIGGLKTVVDGNCSVSSNPAGFGGWRKGKELGSPDSGKILAGAHICSLASGLDVSTFTRRGCTTAKEVCNRMYLHLGSVCFVVGRQLSATALLS